MAKINIQELRLGNIILNQDGNEERVYCLDYQEINHDSETDKYKPIPLSKEIFLRCGFFYLNGAYTNHSRGIFKFYIEREMVSFSVGEIYFSTVHYFHQFQNVYFALSGFELKTATDGKES